MPYWNLVAQFFHTFIVLVVLAFIVFECSILLVLLSVSWKSTFLQYLLAYFFDLDCLLAQSAGAVEYTDGISAEG